MAKSEIPNEEEVPAVVKKTEKRNPGKASAGKASAKQEGNKKTYTHWLMKSEPESRLEKGVDVKVSRQSSLCILASRKIPALQLARRHRFLFWKSLQAFQFQD